MERDENSPMKGNKEMEMMRSSFHIEFPFTILFREWNVSSVHGVLLSCLLLMLLSFLNECVKLIRGHINTVITELVANRLPKSRVNQQQRQVTVIQSAEGCECLVLNGIDVNEKKTSLETLVKAQTSRLASAKRYLLSSGILLHLIHCFLYGLEMFISLALMLSVMSFHTGVLASVVIGAMLGKVILYWPGRFPRVKEEETICH